MAGTLTFSIIKPDAVRNGHAGQVLDQIITAGFRVRAMRLVHLSQAQAEAFYEVHRERGFFKDLVSFMTSGPCVPLMLEKDEAVASFRELIGATDPSKAAPGTIRARFAKSIDANAIHGSDSDENALREIGFFFSELDRV
jgi:nucleoside-diphosphate kinase